MMNLVNTTSAAPVLMNRDLQKATDKVIALCNENIRNDYQIAAIFADVEKSGAFNDDGFKSVIEWGMKCIGFKRAQCYNYLKVGKEYTREVISNKGKNLGYCSNLLPIPDDESNREVTPFGTEPAPAPDKDFTMSQTIALTRLESRDEALKLIHEGKVKPEMSVRDIKKIIDEINKPKPDESDESTEGASEEQKPAKKAHNLSKISTADLINELIKRGYRVSDNEGHVWENDSEPEQKEGKANE